MEPDHRSSISHISDSVPEASGPMTSLDNGFLRISNPRQRALLRVLAFAFRWRVSAAPLVEQLSREYTGKDSLALRQVAELLSAQVPVVSALEQTRGAVDETTLLALRLAEETGTLSDTYELLTSSDSDWRFKHNDPLHSDTTHLMQRAVGILVACLVLSFLMTFVLPTFHVMFDELGSTRPALLNQLSWLFAIFGIPLFLFAMGIIIALVVLTLWNRDWQWQPWKPAYPKRPASVRLQALLALAVGSGRPVVSGLETLTRFQASPSIRNRLVAVTELIRQGEDPWLALARQKLLRTREAETLRLAPDRPTEFWLLQQAAVAGTHWHETLRGSVLQAFSLCVMALLTIVIGLVAIALFLALFGLIAYLA